MITMNKKKWSLLLAILFFSVAAEAKVKQGMSAVRMQGDTVYIENKYSGEYDLQICFTKCMFNQIMTFWRIGLVVNSEEYPLLPGNNDIKTMINLAFSDNIGPISMGTFGSWFGANHSYKEGGKVHTAYTDSFVCFVDGKELRNGDALYAKQVRIEVKNKLYDPKTEIIENGNVVGFSGTMCNENVEYLIQEGNIEVKLTHIWENKEPYYITVYYGMQSMGQGEKIFFPRGHTDDFVQKENGVSRNRQEYPTFNRFIQKGPQNLWYESCYLMPDGIGNHQEIRNEDFIYLVNYGKTYHRQLTNKEVVNGTTYSWRGIYSYVNPIRDDQMLAYIIKSSDGYILIADAKIKGNYRVDLPKWVKKIHIKDSDLSLSISTKISHHSINIEASDKGSCYIKLDK